MPKDPDISFSRIVYEVFDPIIKEYDLANHQKSDQLIVFSKDNIQLLCRLEAIPLFYYFSLEIRLLGELAHQVASEADSKYHHLGVSTIAGCLDPAYKSPLRGAQTEDELRELVTTARDELQKYCRDILLYDVSSWHKVIRRLEENKEDSSSV